MRAILEDLGELAETVEYHSVTEEGLQPPKSIRAIPLEGDLLNSPEIGISTAGGEEPVIWSFSKDPDFGIAEVHPGEDWIERWPGTPRARVYGIVEILAPSDPAEWRVYSAHGPA